MGTTNETFPIHGSDDFSQTCPACVPIIDGNSYSPGHHRCVCSCGNTGFGFGVRPVARVHIPAESTTAQDRGEMIERGMNEDDENFRYGRLDYQREEAANRRPFRWNPQAPPFWPMGWRRGYQGLADDHENSEMIGGYQASPAALSGNWTGLNGHGGQDHGQAFTYQHQDTQHQQPQNQHVYPQAFMAPPGFGSNENPGFQRGQGIGYPNDHQPQHQQQDYYSQLYQHQQVFAAPPDFGSINNTDYGYGQAPIYPNHYQQPQQNHYQQAFPAPPDFGPHDNPSGYQPPGLDPAYPPHPPPFQAPPPPNHFMADAPAFPRQDPYQPANFLDPPPHPPSVLRPAPEQNRTHDQRRTRPRWHQNGSGSNYHGRDWRNRHRNRRASQISSGAQTSYRRSPGSPHRNQLNPPHHQPDYDQQHGSMHPDSPQVPVNGDRLALAQAAYDLHGQRRPSAGSGQHQRSGQDDEAGNIQQGRPPATEHLSNSHGPVLTPPSTPPTPSTPDLTAMRVQLPPSPIVQPLPSPWNGATKYSDSQINSYHHDKQQRQAAQQRNICGKPQGASLDSLTPSSISRSPRTSGTPSSTGIICSDAQDSEEHSFDEEWSGIDWTVETVDLYVRLRDDADNHRLIADTLAARAGWRGNGQLLELIRAMRQQRANNEAEHELEHLNAPRKPDKPSATLYSDNPPNEVPEWWDGPGSYRILSSNNEQNNSSRESAESMGSWCQVDATTPSQTSEAGFSNTLAELSHVLNESLDGSWIVVPDDSSSQSESQDSWCVIPAPSDEPSSIKTTGEAPSQPQPSFPMQQTEPAHPTPESPTWTEISFKEVQSDDDPEPEGWWSIGWVEDEEVEGAEEGKNSGRE